MTPEATSTTQPVDKKPPASQQEVLLRRLARGSERPVIVYESPIPSGLSAEAEEQLRR